MVSYGVSMFSSQGGYPQTNASSAAAPRTAMQTDPVKWPRLQGPIGVSGRSVGIRNGISATGSITTVHRGESTHQLQGLVKAMAPLVKPTFFLAVGYQEGSNQMGFVPEVVWEISRTVDFTLEKGSSWIMIMIYLVVLNICFFPTICDVWLTNMFLGWLILSPPTSHDRFVGYSKLRILKLS